MGKTTETECRMWVASYWQQGGMESGWSMGYISGVRCKVLWTGCTTMAIELMLLNYTGRTSFWNSTKAFFICFYCYYFL